MSLHDLTSIEELSSRIGFSSETLIWLSINIRNQVTTERKRKKSGGYREITKPSSQLKNVLRCINNHLLQNIPLPSNLHGSVPRKSTITNASQHVGKPVVLTMDIRDFYPSVRYTKVLDLFLKIGCSKEVARLLTRLTTYNGSLPQGFPTSSTIANLILAEFIPRISTACEKHKVTFTFYQDDLCVSGGKQVKDLPNLLSRILYQEGYKTHPKKHPKTKVMLRSEQQIVTGKVVNKKVNVPRKTYRDLRAKIHYCKVRGISEVAKISGMNEEKFRQHLHGRIAQVLATNRKLGEKLLAEFETL